MLTLQGADAAVTALAFSPDGRTLAAGDADGVVRLWNPAQRKAIMYDLGPSGLVLLAFTREGHLAAVGGGAVWLWASPDEEPCRCDTTGVLESAALAPDERAVVLAESRLRWVTLRSGARFWSVDPQGPCDEVAFSHDGAFLATAHTRKVLLWTPNGLAAALPAPLGPLRDMQFAPHRPTLAALDDDGLWLWNVTRPTERPRSLADVCYLRSIAFHPSGQWLALAGDDGVVRVYDSDTLAQTNSFPLDQGRIWSAVFSPNGEQAAVGLQDGRIILWNLTA